MTGVGESVPRVCLVLRYYTVGGLERVVTSLANRLAARGVDTRVVVLGTSRRDALITELDPVVDVVPLTGSRRSRLAQLTELSRDRVVHLHFGDGRIHPFLRVALRDRAVVVTYHSVYTHKRTWLANRVDRLANLRTRAVVAVSNAVREFCVDHVGIAADRIEVIPNAVSVDAVPSASTAGGLDLISVAGLYPHKNQATLLRGVAAARAAGLAVTLRVVGDGPRMAELYRQSIELDIRSSVDWYGAVWRRDIVLPLMSKAHVFVSASRFEGMPISILEAMACGLPMVLSDIPAHREVAGDAAVYFGPDDPGALAAALAGLTDATRHAELSEASRRRGARFDLEAAVDAHLAVYQRVTQ